MLYRSSNLKFSTRTTVVFLVTLLTAVSGSGRVHASCNSPTFGPPSAFPVGTYPVSPSVGDFNGDGKPDLVVANQGDPFGCETNQICDSISVLLGNGNGTFQPAVHYPAGGRPSSIALGDFNGDNKLDLAVANNIGAGTVSVLLGNGNGTFQSAVSYSAGNSPLSVIAADFNEDNRLDLAVANYANPGNVSILTGNANGTFNTKVDYNTGSYPESVAVADFNGDHHLDLVVARNLSAGGVSKLLGNGNGTFQAVNSIASAAYPESVIAGDFNLDGHADVAVVSDNSPGKVILLRGQGNGNFLAATNYATGTYPLSLEFGDYNADGKPDFAVVDDTGLSILLQTTNGTFQTTSGISAGFSPYALATGDFNNDGSPDLATSSFATNGAVFTLLNNCVTASTGNGVVLKNAARHGDGLFHFTIMSPAGAVLVVAASTNLTVWTQIAVVTNVTGTMDFADPASAGLSRRFYRVGVSGTGAQAMTVAGMTRLPDGNMRFNLLSANGQIFRVQASTNLSTTNWVTVANLTNPGGNLQFTDTSATNHPQRFYRMVSP